MDASDPVKALFERVIAIRGAGEMATGIACRLYRSNLRRILMLEIDAPLAVRRSVSFSEAVHDGKVQVEGIQAVRIDSLDQLAQVWEQGMVAVLVDPMGESLGRLHPDAFVDATVAKRNLGTSIADAPLVIGLGPGFTAGVDCHVIVETNRGHDLGRLIHSGGAEPNTGIPGDIAGYTRERVLRAPVDGVLSAVRAIGDPVERGEVVCKVGSAEVRAEIDGVVRGLIRPGSYVTRGLKIGDVDPRGNVRYCGSISEKARTLGGAVLEAVLQAFNRDHCLKE